MDHNDERSPARKLLCDCCPYGYHIDVDFIKLCDEFSKSEINGREHANKNRYCRIKRTSSQTMGSLLGLFPSDFNQTAVVYKMRDQPACASPCVQESFQQAVQDFEDTLDQSSGYAKPSGSTGNSPFSFEKLQHSISSSPYNDTKSSSEESEFQSSDSKESTHNEEAYIPNNRYSTPTPEYKITEPSTSITKREISMNTESQNHQYIDTAASRYAKLVNGSGGDHHQLFITTEPTARTEKPFYHRVAAIGTTVDDHPSSSSSSSSNNNISKKLPQQTRDIGVNCVRIITRDVGIVHRPYSSTVKHVATHTEPQFFSASSSSNNKDVGIQTTTVDDGGGSQLGFNESSSDGVVNLLQILRTTTTRHVVDNPPLLLTINNNASTQTDDYNNNNNDDKRPVAATINFGVQIKPETRDSAVSAKPSIRDEYSECINDDYDDEKKLLEASFKRRRVYSSSSSRTTHLLDKYQLDEQNNNSNSNNNNKNNRAMEQTGVLRISASPILSSRIPKFNANPKPSSPKLQRQNTYTVPPEEPKQPNVVLPVVVPRSPSFDSSPSLEADDLLLKCYSKTNIHNDNVYYFQPTPKSRQKMKFSEEFRNALEDLNDYLQKRRPHLPASRVNNICKIVQKEWFKVFSADNADIQVVEGYLNNFKDISRTLLDYVVNMRDETGNTTMHYAISHSNFDVVSTLLNSNVCNTNIVNNAGYTCVMLVSLAEIKSNTHYSVIKRLFNISDINVKAKKHGQTALMLAVSHGKVDIVRLLLDAGADVNVQDDDGSTALMCATDHEYVDIVNLLISRPDCDLNIADHDGNTALTIAVEANNKEITLALYKKQQISDMRSSSRPHRSYQVKFAH